MPCGYKGGSATSSRHPLVGASSVLCMLVSASRCLHFLSKARDGSADNTKKTEPFFVNMEEHCGETSVEDAVGPAKATQWFIDALQNLDGPVKTTSVRLPLSVETEKTTH